MFKLPECCQNLQKNKRKLSKERFFLTTECHYCDEKYKFVFRNTTQKQMKGGRQNRPVSRW